jgi:hypothetical protein
MKLFETQTLAQRLGLTVHVSAFRMRVKRLSQLYPSATASSLEDWLLDVANCRGARIVIREPARPLGFQPPPRSEFRDEELVIAICMLQGVDQPQLLRLAAQLISRNVLELPVLIRLAIRERVGPVLKALAQAALKVEPTHAAWRCLARTFEHSPVPHDVVMHWSRMAQPVMAKGRVNAASWRLVA